MKSIFQLLGSVACVGAAALSAAQEAPKVSLKLQPTAQANKAMHGVLTVTFATGLHGYQNPPTDPDLIPITVKAADKSVRLIMVDYPKGKPSKVIGESKPINIYEGTIQIPVILQAPAKLGKTSIKLSLGYQMCNASACFPPGKVVAESTITVIKYTGTIKLMAPPKGR